MSPLPTHADLERAYQDCVSGSFAPPLVCTLGATILASRPDLVESLDPTAWYYMTPKRIWLVPSEDLA